MNYLKQFGTFSGVLGERTMLLTSQAFATSPADVIMHILWPSFKTVAIDIPGGKRSLVKNIIAQTTILKRAIKK